MIKLDDGTIYLIYGSFGKKLSFNPIIVSFDDFISFYNISLHNGFNYIYDYI